MRYTFVVLALFLLTILNAQFYTEGGNVTNVNSTGIQNSSHWAGFYGQVIENVNSTILVTPGPGTITLQNLQYALPSGCSLNSIHVIATNSTTISLPLTPGNLSLLDSLLGSAEGANTFTSTSTFDLSYGSFTNVPTTYTYSATPPSTFRMGYLQDTNGNLVFVADIVNDRVDWNNSLSDYQIMLPDVGTFRMWVDIDATCNVTSPPSKKHELYIHPISTVNILVGTSKLLHILVENKGDYNEYDVNITLEFPPGNISSIGFEDIYKNQVKDLSAIIFGFEIGSFIAYARAGNDRVSTFRAFIVNVLPECNTSQDCGEDDYCDNGICEEKKELGEECSDADECFSGVCNETCVECYSDADCGNGEYCSNGYCVDVECPCGVVEMHQCNAYECCEDNDCNASQICENHECIDNDLILEYEKPLIEGEFYLFKVSDLRGRGVNGTFESDYREYPLLNGSANAMAPYSEVVCANSFIKKCWFVDVIKRGRIEIIEIGPGGTIKGIILDSHGKPISNVIVKALNQTTMSDEKGLFELTIKKEGYVRIEAFKSKYLIEENQVNLLRGIACPVFVFYKIVEVGDVYVLWLVLFALSIIDLHLLKRISVKKGALLSAIPLVLSLPNTSCFNPCTMVSVSFIYTLFVALYRWWYEKT